MIREHLANGMFKTYWTKTRIIKHAKKYHHRTDWIKYDEKSYMAAVYRNLLKDPKVVGHFEKILKIN